MRDRYQQLLQATIEHLEGLKARGGQFVSVSPSILQALKPGLIGSTARGEPARGSANATPLRTALRPGPATSEPVLSSAEPESPRVVANALGIPEPASGLSTLLPEAKTT